MNIQTIKNVSDCVPLYLPHSLYLKPIAKLSISVQLPTAITGKTLSNWDVMEKLRKLIEPDKYSALKVNKSTLEVIRLDAELEERGKMKSVISRLDGSTIKLSGYSESAKVRAAEAKDNFPKRHDWDSYFRDARNMDEKKAGERPDTIHISNLPMRWFCPRHQENDEVVRPSESIFKRIFEKFGDVRTVDIPICDPYRKDMKSHMTGMKTFSFDQELYFEGYVQFSEYQSFKRTLDEFRAMKLVHKEGDKNLAIDIIVDFDKTKHLSDGNIKRRKVIRDRLIAKEMAKKEEEQKVIDEEKAREEKEKQRQELLKQEEQRKQQEREERRKERHLKRLREQEQTQLSSKIRSEEKKLLIAQRKLESIRVLEALFERIKLKNSKISSTKIKNEDGSSSSSHVKRTENEPRKFDLRDKLIRKVKTVQEQELERQRNRVKKAKANNILGSALERSPSVNSISSDDSVLSDGAVKKKRKRKKSNREANSSSSSSSSSGESTDAGKHKEILAPIATPGSFPMFNPETGQWVNVGMGMGMYPYPGPFYPPGMRTDYYPNSTGPYRGFRGGYRGRFIRGRGRGSYRGRGGYQSYDGDYHKDDHNDYDDDYDYKRNRDGNRRGRRRSRNRRSHSRSRSYSSRSRSRSRNRSRRSPSRSRNKKSRSRSRSRSHSKSEETKSKKLVSTLRRSRSESSGWSSRSRSHSKTQRSWSKRGTSHHSHSRSRSRSRNKSNSHSRPRKHDSKSKKKEKSEREKRSEEKSHRSERDGSTKKSERNNKSRSRSKSRARSPSIDSTKFQSPKRKQRSETPEKTWD